MAKYAIFLGAGASKTDGAPMQAELFSEYFKENKDANNHLVEIKNFFEKMFGEISDNIKFPTFEEALGMLDLAELRNESFRNFSNINFNGNKGDIRYLRLCLVFLMAEIIKQKLQTSKGKIHGQLISNLKQKNLLKDTCFVTTNYDILCDNALLRQQTLLGEITSINYGFEFCNYGADSNTMPPHNNSPLLFKLHGSLNWLFCPTCNTVKLTPQEKGAADLMILLETEPNQAKCNECQSFYSPIIIPPTFYKNLSNVYLSMVWNKAELELTSVKHIVFCGYSFPDADIHIKYLIKRIQTNRHNNDLKITVVNNHQGKSKGQKEEEKDRFIRFLGNKVNYTNKNFVEFASNPQPILEAH